MIKKLKLLRRASVATTRLEAVSAMLPLSRSRILSQSMDPMDAKPPLVVRTVSLKFLNAANLKTAIDKMSYDARQYQRQ